MSANGTPPTTTAVMVPKAGEVARREFGADQLSRTGETASTAMAAQASAAVQARYVMAMKNPRDLLAVRGRLLKDCSRPGFADAAIYHKPLGKGIEGPSIRLAEAAARAMTNVYSSVTAIYDDERRRIIRVSATDLESNLTFDKDVTVPKTMERSKLRPGQVPLKQRTNSQGNTTFLVEAETDDDILNTENALASKALRVCLLRLIPGDLLEEALSEAYRTIDKGIKDDPDAALKKMCDSYGLQLGITPAQLKAYLGHPVAETTVAEIALLRKLFSALKDGETSWTEVMESRATTGPADPAAPKDAAAVPKGKANVTDLAAEAKSKREAASKPAEPKAEPAKAERVPGDDDGDDDKKNAAAAAPTAEEIARMEAEAKASEPSDDDLPPWMKGKQK